MIIGFDGDDTLWHSEREFAETQAELRSLLSRWVDDEETNARLLATERRNLALFGYGVKAFTLSMIETAIEVSGGEISATEIHHLVGLGKALLHHPVELLDGVREVVEQLSAVTDLVLVTKGDLLHQETKVAASGISERFAHVEIVNEKDPATYRRILERHRIDPADFVMVGNSVRSDVLPVLDIGGRAVHVPYEITWEIETVASAGLADFPTIATVEELPSLLAGWGLELSR
jgi:putative hydrolase of the HAD superfamily